MWITITVPTSSVFELVKIPLNVEPSDTLHSLKIKIEAETGIPVADQWILGPWDDLMDMSRTLQEEHIQEGAAICVRRYLVLFVNTLAGNTMRLFVEACETVYSVKVRIKDKDGIPTDEQRLCFAGQELPNHHTLAQCNVKDQSNLQLLRV